MPSERHLRIAAAVLCLLGLGIAGSVAITVAGGGIPQCVGGSAGCATVEKSKYSEMIGIHISVFGIIGYASILAATLWRGDPGRIVAFVLSLFGFGFSLYLTYLEFWVIEAICQWCVASAIVMTLLFAVNTARVLGYFGLDRHPAAGERQRNGDRDGDQISDGSS
jgi:uncharacterized membrane protein